MTFKTGDKVRLVTGTLFVAKGGEGTIVDPMKGQTPPQLFPWRVQFPIGQDTRTVWCGTDELELVVDAGGPTADNPVADGSRDYCPEGGPEDGNPADTAPAGPPEVCPCLTDGVCSIDYANNPDLDGAYANIESALLDEGPWADGWDWTGEDVSDFEATVHGVFCDAEELLLQKHKDYGPSNIDRAPGGALNGLRVRMHDKLARINNLYEKDEEDGARFEPLKDSFIDLLNYAAIGIMVLEGTWPSE